MTIKSSKTNSYCSYPDIFFIGAHSIAEMVSKLKKPRRVMMLVKAGKPVDEFIEQLIPHLEAGDIIIDGGNSLFDDTNRRQKYVESKGCCTSAPA